MQVDQTYQQSHEDQHNQSHYPSDNNLNQIHFPTIFAPQQCQADQKQEQMHKGSTYHHKERPIVDLPYTAVDPYAVMVKFGNTPKSDISYLSHCLQWREVM